MSWVKKLVKIILIIGLVGCEKKKEDKCYACLAAIVGNNSLEEGKVKLTNTDSETTAIFRNTVQSDSKYPDILYKAGASVCNYSISPSGILNPNSKYTIQFSIQSYLPLNVYYKVDYPNGESYTSEILAPISTSEGGYGFKNTSYQNKIYNYTATYIPPSDKGEYPSIGFYNVESGNTISVELATLFSNNLYTELDDSKRRVQLQLNAASKTSNNQPSTSTEIPITEKEKAKMRIGAYIADLKITELKSSGNKVILSYEKYKTPNFWPGTTIEMNWIIYSYLDLSEVYVKFDFNDEESGESKATLSEEQTSNSSAFSIGDNKIRTFKAKNYYTIPANKFGVGSIGLYYKTKNSDWGLLSYFPSGVVNKYYCNKVGKNFNFVTHNISRVYHPLNSNDMENPWIIDNFTFGDKNNYGFHKGLDIKVKSNQNVNVYSICKGEVIYTEDINKKDKSGNYVYPDAVSKYWNAFRIIKHDCSGVQFYAYYGHIDYISVSKNIEKGTPIGTVKVPPTSQIYKHLHLGITSSKDWIRNHWGYTDNLSDAKMLYECENNFTNQPWIDPNSILWEEH